MSTFKTYLESASKIKNIKSEKELIDLFWKLFQDSCDSITFRNKPLDLNLRYFRKLLYQNNISASRQITNMVKSLSLTYKSYDNQGDIIKVVESPKTSNYEVFPNLSHPKIIRVHSLLKELNKTFF